MPLLTRTSSDFGSFREHLRESTYILALLGAGVSASSGLPTFRGSGGLWRTHNATDLATPGAFEADPGLVWQFYSYRRHMALKAKPNPAHRALAELARKRGGFLTLSQNVDGLSPRAGHPPLQLHLLHGSLFDVKCTDFYCTYAAENYTDPIVPALALPTANDDRAAPAASNGGSVEATPIDPTTTAARDARELDLADAAVALPELRVDDLPRCPACGTGLLRPGVVWFGEPLPRGTIDAVDEWIAKAPRIDLMLVVGTSSRVYPAAGYVAKAQAKGARVAVVDVEPAPPGGMRLRERDWFFCGDAAEVVPEMLRDVIGEELRL